MDERLFKLCMLLFSSASQGLLIQSPVGVTQSPLVLRGKLVDNTPPPEDLAFSQGLENSKDLENTFEKPQQMNDNDQDSSLINAFEQTSDNFRISNNVSPPEQPRTGFEIDLLGPVDDVGPREEISFIQHQPILFQTTEEEDIQTFFGGGEIILEQKNNNLEDLATVKEFDNFSGTSDTINTVDNNEALNIPVIIEEGPLAEVDFTKKVYPDHIHL